MQSTRHKSDDLVQICIVGSFCVSSYKSSAPCMRDCLQNQGVVSVNIKFTSKTPIAKNDILRNLQYFT